MSCFAVLKRSYGRQIEELMRLGVSHIDKTDFLTAYVTTRQETFTSANIRNGFQATGLLPYDPDYVLAKLNTQLRTPTPPAPPPENVAPWVPETPHDIHQLERQVTAIRGFIEGRTRGSSSPTDQAIRQLAKGCQLAMHSAVILADENRRLRTKNDRQKKKRSKRRSYIATGGILSVQEGLDRSVSADLQLAEQVTDQVARLQTRAPKKCSMCKSLTHTARTCPLRDSSN